MFAIPDSFRIDVGEIDIQHDFLVDMINDLIRAIELGDNPNCRTNFEAFKNRLVAHFAYEEEIMQTADYPGLDWHREHHRNALDNVNALQSQCLSTGRLTVDILEDCIQNVISDIAKADLKFAAFLKDKH